MKPQRRVTLKKLAEILELDVSSISLALRDSPKISHQTRQRINDLANQYGYSPNMAARQLRSSTPQLIGLVLPSMMNALSNPMAGRTIQVLAELCTAKSIMFQILSVANLADSPEGQTISGLLPESLFVWGDVPCQTIATKLLKNRPVIVLDPSHLSYAGYSGRCISVDNFSGGAAIARHLLELKTNRLLLVQVRTDHLGHNARLAGARQTWLKQRPAKSLTRCVMSELDDEALIKFVRQGNGAIFCSNDLGALQLWHRFVQLGLKMPDDVRLAGFDGEEAALLAGITTMIFDWHTLATTAMKTMFQLLTTSDGSNSLPASIAIPAFLRRGQTT
ncbi:MAG: LacI family DNA-binding transcriptional regulator [Kiritimatiellaeota bacterium]|nr:LacI family DNA-binding transcriptional regulator [Kiritimatiellota bacterium]